jgi:hypothetical protein
MNSHRSLSASAPPKRAGPIERAGFTDVPVAGIATMCTAKRVRPMASGARAGCSLRESVTARITNTKTAVRISSSTNAAHQEMPPTPSEAPKWLVPIRPWR